MNSMNDLKSVNNPYFQYACGTKRSFVTMNLEKQKLLSSQRTFNLSEILLVKGSFANKLLTYHY